MIKSIVPTLLIVLTYPFQLSTAADQLRAAASAAAITPPVGFPMWGYSARKDLPSQGVLDPLKARALVLEVGKERLAIVSLDLGRAPTRAHTAAIRERVRSAGVTDILLVASHTHHGPVLELDNWPDPKNPYTAKLDQQIGDVILTAVKNLVPARWGVASHETQLNHNRHSKRPDAPVDRTLSVVRIEALDGRPIAHVINFAAHPTMTDIKDRRFSADYVGAFAALVEKETGVPCLFLQGAAGDLSPAPPAGVHGPAEFGHALGKDAMELAKTIRCEESKQPALRVESEEFTFKPRLDVGNPLVKAALSNAFFPDFIAFYEREYREGVRPQMTVAMLDDRLGIVGVSGEFFCGHALSLRRRARMDHLLFCAYCNDYQQYFPTIEAVTEGGYGTAPPVAMAELGAGERMMDRALIRLYRLRGLLGE